MKLVIRISFVCLLLAFAGTAGADPAFWRVESEDNTIYVLGTMHRLPDGKAWFSDELQEILENADTLVMEVKSSRGAKEYLGFLTQQEGVALSRQPLALAIGEKAFETYTMKMAAYGVSKNTFERYKPWYAALFLALLGGERAGYFSHYGVETVLERFAKEHSIQRLGLETYPQQFLFYAELPDDTQVRYFATTLEHSNDFQDRFDSQFEAWFAGDTATIADLVLAPLREDPLIYDTLIVNRNKAWLEQFEYFLAEGGTYFIAVGTGHLVGPDSVLKMLEDKGYQVTRQ